MPVKANVSFEDDNFTSIKSPALLNCNVALSRNATQFSVQNDGDGSFTVKVSIDGNTFGEAKTVKSGEVYAVDEISFFSLEVTHIADSAYRIVAF